MKKILSLIAFFFIHSCFAQPGFVLTNAVTNQTISPNGAYYETTAPNGTYSVVYNVTNTSAVTHTYIGFRYNVVLNPGGAAASFCFAGGCYGPPAYSSNYLVLNPGQSASDITGTYQMLNIDFEESPSTGYSHIKYSVVCVDVPTDSVQINVKYNDPNGLAEINNTISHLNVWPNPASQRINISGYDQKEIKGELKMLNVLGQTVKYLELNKASIISINVSDIPKGIYFIQVRSETTSATKRILVN
jgi:hypothetical protein